MNKDFRLATNFASNIKFRRLVRRLGDHGGLSWVRLLAYVADQRCDGDISGMDAEEIAEVAGYEQDAQTFLDTMLELGLVDRDDDDELVVHNWIAWNPWAAGAEGRSEQARRAVQKSWQGKNVDQRRARTQIARSSKVAKDKDSSELCADSVLPAQDVCADSCAGSVLPSVPLSSPILSSPYLSDPKKSIEQEICISYSSEKDPEKSAFADETEKSKSDPAEISSPKKAGNILPFQPATRIPDDFRLNQYRVEMARRIGLRDDQISEAFEEFLDYWRSVPDKAGVRQDWDAIWRMRCRYLMKQGRAGSMPSGKMPMSRKTLAAMQLAEYDRQQDAKLANEMETLAVEAKEL
jgi:hypothetical protein